MTYKEIVNSLIEIVKSHKIVRSVGYGNLTDLVEPLKRENRASDNIDYEINYPYVFINPTAHTLTKNKTTYSFNLIVMEQPKEGTLGTIQAQSECYEYIKDILARIYYELDLDFNLNSQVTPFQEKYNDVVAGMTATITIQVRDPLNDCITPFNE